MNPSQKKNQSVEVYYTKLAHSCNVNGIISKSDVSNAVTIYNNVQEYIKQGFTDLVNKLSTYIETYPLSIETYRKVCTAFKSASPQQIDDLLNGKIKGNNLINDVLSAKHKQSNISKSFDEIYSEIKDIYAVQDNHLKNTAELFERGVDYLDNIVERILSDEYIGTFKENDVESHTSIINSLNRLDQIKNVISSLI